MSHLRRFAGTASTLPKLARAAEGLFSASRPLCGFETRSFRCRVQVGEVGALLSHTRTQGTPQGRRLSRRRLRLRLDGQEPPYGGCEVHQAPDEQQHTCRPLLVLVDSCSPPSALPYLLAMATEKTTTRTTPRMAPKLRFLNGTGPPPARYVGRSPLWRKADILRWIEQSKPR
jgi:hypothetical protein